MADTSPITPTGVAEPRPHADGDPGRLFRKAVAALTRVVALETVVARTPWTDASHPALHAQELAFEQMEAHLRGLCATAPLRAEGDPDLHGVAEALYRTVTAEDPAEMREALRDLDARVEDTLAGNGARTLDDLRRTRILAACYVGIFVRPRLVHDGELPVR